MKPSLQKRLLAGSLAAVMALGSSMTGMASAAPDGKTDGKDLASAMGTDQMWENWKQEWETIKDDWTQISLTPGSDETELNFAWYSKKETAASGTQDEIGAKVAKVGAPQVLASSAPKLIIGEGRNMKNARVYAAAQEEATQDSKTGEAYLSNKVTATGLKEETTYYYSYEQEDGTYTEPEAYTVKGTEAFSFIYVGDPQIGSSNELKGADTEEFYNAQSEAVRSDAYNWNATLNAAMEKTRNQASFVVSAGDQIQTTKAKAPGKNAANSEIEYAGYLSPDVLKSLPVATTVGNHDADNPNYRYHFHTPNSSELGSNGIVGGDYYFTYGSALFIMLNTQDTNTAEHKQFMEQAIAANPDCEWRIVTLHQDIYGSAEHSNEPEITNLRYTLVPYFEENDIDVVLTGHDHAYSRSEILKGGVKSVEYTDDEFDEQLDKDMDAGENPETRYEAPGNIQDDTQDAAEQAYLDYLNSIMDAQAVEQTKTEGEAVINPDGILYMTANSSSGSKYYDLVPRMQTYIANRWQEDVPTYSVVDITDSTLTINTYRTDNDEKIDQTFTIAKMDVDKTELQKQIQAVQTEIIPQKGAYTQETFTVLEQALAGAKAVYDDTKATNTEVQSALKALINARAALNRAVVLETDISKAAVEDIKDQTYSGKAKKPEVNVTLNGRKLTEGTDYQVSYSNHKNTGIAKAVIQGMGAYSGKQTVSFKIKPKKVQFKSLGTPAAKRIKAVWKAQKGKITGYQIQYSLNKNFTKAKTKSKLVKANQALLKSLKPGKTYYIRVRAFKKTSEGRIYGSFSKVKRVKVKQ